jgi:hypothetical protein
MGCLPVLMKIEHSHRQNDKQVRLTLRLPLLFLSFRISYLLKLSCLLVTCQLPVWQAIHVVSYHIEASTHGQPP